MSPTPADYWQGTRKDVINLGSNHSIIFGVWNPDLKLNPQAEKYKAHLPLKCSGIIRHHTPQGDFCEGVITFDSPTAREVFPKGPFWQVESWEPLTLSPSILCHCGDHGFIKQGKWVAA